MTKLTPHERLKTFIVARVRRWVRDVPDPALAARYDAAEQRAARLSCGAYLDGMRTDLIVRRLREAGVL